MVNAILLSKYFFPNAQAALSDILHKNTSEITLGFCANAGDVYNNERRKYIAESKEELISSSFKLIDIDLNSSRDRILDEFSQIDATFFTGGSFYMLMKLFQDAEIKSEYLEMLESGLVHIGFSAGAMICSPNFKAYDVFVEFKQEEVEEGLNIFPNYIIPHYHDKPKYTKIYNDVFQAGFENTIPLTNHQAIIVRGDDWKIIE